MATTREIVKRRKSVTNIRKITKTMEMIATSRFKKSFTRAVGAKPYTKKISELVGALAGGDETVEHPLLHVNEESQRTALLVLTSNRGLCGGYNSNINRLALQHIEELKGKGLEIDLRVSGKKGQQALKYKGHVADVNYAQFDDKTTYAMVEELANEFIGMYTRREIDAVQVVYTRFISSARHTAEVLNLLPLSALEGEQEKTEKGGLETGIDFFEFYPSAQEILQELIPTTVRTRLFQCFTDAIVSEQVARMSAMKAATDNAEQMIEALTRQYNRARQSQITGELLDILGGAEAIK